MKNILLMIASAAVLSLGAVAMTPSEAAAQCQWGCACTGDACGCNSNGNGGRCDATASGCVVSGCTGTKMSFAPDGSAAQFAANDANPASRWEWVANGREVERACSGLVIARRFSAAEADAVRRQHRTILALTDAAVPAAPAVEDGPLLKRPVDAFGVPAVTTADPAP